MPSQSALRIPGRSVLTLVAALDPQWWAGICSVTKLISESAMPGGGRLRELALFM